MKCTRIRTSADELLDPTANGWNRVSGEALGLAATPLANQPTEYVRVSRDAGAIGAVRNLLVQAAHTGTDIVFRLTWEDPTHNAEVTDSNMFPDGCGILMPLNGGNPPIDEMGSEQMPVNAWFWRADSGDTARNVIARGLGTTQASQRSVIRTRAHWGNGAWAVVFARALAVPEQEGETVQLAPGVTVKVGFAVWEGSNGERAGIKSFSREWRDLKLDA